MSHFVHIDPTPGASLRDRLFELGVEFPCGGTLLCGSCRVRVVAGDVPVTAEMREVLTGAEIAQGWRLGCFAVANGPVTIEVEQWSAPILTGHETLRAEPRDGFGIAIDLGTTTLAAQLVDLTSGEVLATETALNPQARHGADLMSRIGFDGAQPGVLRGLIRTELGAMAAHLAAGRTVSEVLICGNTAMHHLFCGLSVDALAEAPFRTPYLDAQSFHAPDLGWSTDIAGPITFLPNIGGFVGSDILAGLIACGLIRRPALTAFADLGTNGEVAVGSSSGIVCASTAAGPAFEAGRIGMGMRAGAGAIDRVDWRDGALHCRVIGGTAARGICGSGLVDAAAALAESGLVLPTGRMSNGVKEIALAEGVILTQSDIRELQLAKGAIAAGALLLRDRLGVEKPATFHLAGAFGNYVRAQSARRIGLLPDDSEVVAEGNAALRGTRLLLLRPSSRESLIEETLSRTEHVELGGEAAFQDAFAACMRLAPLAWDDLPEL
ncbi:MAG: ASKHA domain-containing protein [Bryobacteraceae bacterium]|nr:ASKHA domain-containing protein [Bryobacteraceae bacterium]